MYRPHKYVREPSRYTCKDCRIACTSSKQLEQHLNGIKHKRAVCMSSNEAEENTFPLENMVVIDQTEEDYPYESAASPASCDSSDSATAACASDFQTIDSISTSHMVILDETNDDNDNPASPASCDSSASESAPSSPATLKLSEIPEKKPRIEIPEDDQTAPGSPQCALLSWPSSSSVQEGEAGKSEKHTSKEHHGKSSKTRHKESKKTFHIEPIKSNQDVFQFMKTFAISNDSDVAFAKKVKELFSNALKKYKEIKLEDIICTEAEHSSPEELEGPDDATSDHEQTHSIPQATVKSECERINSAPISPTNSSPEHCISIPMSSADCKADSPIKNQSDNNSPIASPSPTDKCEEIDHSNVPSTANSTNDNSCSAIEADLLMESESCVTAEAACSDDEDV